MLFPKKNSIIFIRFALQKSLLDYHIWNFVKNSVSLFSYVKYLHNMLDTVSVPAKLKTFAVPSDALYHIQIWQEVLGTGYESGFKKYGTYSLTCCPQWIWMRTSQTSQVTPKIRILDHSGLSSHLWFINRMLIFKLNSRFLFQLLRNGLKTNPYIITYAKN